jgi:RNA polymerase sigma factor (TIGR02999 family)
MAILVLLYQTYNLMVMAIYTIQFTPSAIQVSLSEAADLSARNNPDLIALDDALTTLEKLDPRQARTVELRFFGGLSLEEAAEVLRVSVSTVRRDWRMAQAWLHQQLSETA